MSSKSVRTDRLGGPGILNSHFLQRSVIRQLPRSAVEASATLGWTRTCSRLQSSRYFGSAASRQADTYQELRGPGDTWHPTPPDFAPCNLRIGLLMQGSSDVVLGDQRSSGHRTRDHVQLGQLSAMPETA